MSTVNNEALESIKNEMKGASMGAVANKGFYFEISENEKDTMILVTNLLNKLGIKVKEVENKNIQEVKEKELSYQQAKNDFFTKYAGSLKISDNAEEEYNQHRVAKYGK